MALHEIHWNPHTRDAEWVGHKGTIPVCEVVRFSCVEGPSIDAIGPIGTAIAERIMAALREAA